MPIDVGVDDAHLQAAVRHGDREVDGDRRLADTALAGGDGEHLGQRSSLREGDVALRAPAAQALLHGLSLVVGHHAQRDLDLMVGSDLGDGRSDVGGEPVLERACGDGQQDRRADGRRVGRGIDDDVVDHAELGDRALDLRVVDLGEGLADQLDGG